MRNKVTYLLLPITAILLSSCVDGGGSSSLQPSYSSTSSVTSSISSEVISSSGGVSSIESSTSSGSIISSSSSGSSSSSSSEIKEVSFVPDVGEVRLLFEHGIPGEDRFYNYCPTIFVDENNQEHVYYCTNEIDGNVTDNIGYRKGIIRNNNISYSNESLVISPTPSTWDQRHACDPSVCKGEFKYNGETYYYLMAYLGCIPSDCTLNETGIAVAKSPEGPWIKCNGKTNDGRNINPIVPCSDFPSIKNNNWGTGQPSLVSVDNKGKVLLFTTIGASDGTFTNLREYDFSDINNFQLIREKRSIKNEGIVGSGTNANFINNADFAYDIANRKFLMIKGRQFFGKKDNKQPDYIADTLDVYYLDDTEWPDAEIGEVFFKGNASIKQWKLIGSINQDLTGFLRNHNSCIISDPYGHVDTTNAVVPVAFTRSDEGDNTWAFLSTYRIYATSLSLSKTYFKK